MKKYNFEEYHKQNPHVYAKFLEVAFEAKKRGFKTYSAEGIIEVIRWETAVSAKSDKDHFKINNNAAPDYARLIMKELPDEFGGFFKVRELKKPRSINDGINGYESEMDSF